MSSDRTHEPRSIGLALSGGGFRGVLFHLGVIRALREAGVLDRVRTIASVSGGSIVAAHLNLNWHRFTGCDREFDEAVQDLLRFVSLGPRSRILNRLPWLFLTKSVWRRFQTNLPRDQRASARTWIYHRYLGRLFRGNFLGSMTGTPSRPRPATYLLATNLTTGGLCAFSDFGLIPNLTTGDLASIQSLDDDLRKEGDPHRIWGLETGLVPISLAVGASSAFPQFFPAVPISVQMLGVERSGVQADPQLLIDGGVMDNTAMLAFSELYETGPTDGDSGAGSGEEGASGESREAEPPFELRPRSIAMHRRPQGDRAVGEPLDVVIESNAGMPFDFQSVEETGMVKAAARVIDILMNRIEMLARDTRPGFETWTIDIKDEDRSESLLNVDVQRRLKNVRTDLDAFSPSETKALLRHGYAIGRMTLAKALGRELPPVTEREAWRDCTAQDGRSRMKRMSSVVSAAFRFLSFLAVVAMSRLVSWIRGRSRIPLPQWKFLYRRVLRPVVLGRGAGRPTVELRRHSGAESVFSYLRRPNGQEAPRVTQVIRARDLMKSSGRRLLSGMADDWMSIVNVAVIAGFLAGLGFVIIRFAWRG